jgi:2-dehydro-3-deoxyphosphogluconate aldolase/(4S)-4-hydroxy-2-oxoglutarate aldolase
MTDVIAMFKGRRIMPIITLDDAASAAPLAHALLAGGITAAEITLRTPAALDAIRVARASAPGLIMGAGTIRTPRDVDDAVAAGAQFLVTPGVTPCLVPALQSAPVPTLPGVATLSEAMARHEEGFQLLKLFPAESCGGVAALKAFAGPTPDLMFAPTGGITENTLGAYLALPNVLTVGGSWIATRAEIAAGAWDVITAKAKRSVELAAQA